MGEKLKQIKLAAQKDKRIPLMQSTTTPIIDPFDITAAQQDFASDKAFALHRRRCKRKLSEAESLEKDIFDAIQDVPVSKNWAIRGNLDPHWSQVSARAIAQLQQLGFCDNADVQRYLETGEMPNALQ